MTATMTRKPLCTPAPPSDLDDLSPLDHAARRHDAEERHWRQQLVKCNLGLVGKFLTGTLAGPKVLVEFLPPGGMDREDLFQSGVIGLMEAARRYDPRRVSKRTGQPVRFSTCAIFWVRQACQRAVEHEAYLIRTPSKTCPRFAREVARSRRVINLPTIRADTHQREWEPAVKGYDVTEADPRLARAMEFLHPLERRVVEMRFWGRMTFKEMAAVVGVSKARVQQRLVDAVARLRAAMGRREKSLFADMGEGE